ncbi:MAG: glycosyltransferase family 4 protein [Actinomycetes bacterium]
MRLLFVVQRFGAGVVGGAEKYVADLATGLAADGHQVTVLTSCATSYEDWSDVCRPGTEVVDGVTVHRLAVTSARDNERFLPLHARAVAPSPVPLWPVAQERWSRLMGPDLAGAELALAELVPQADVTVFVGYHYAHTMRHVRTAAAFGPVVVVPTAHPEGALHVGVVRQMFEHADRVLCLAPEEGELLGGLFDVADRVRVAPCPVAPRPLPAADEVAAVARSFGVVPGRYVVVVGRVDPAKGSDDAVRFMRHYQRYVDPGVRLVVVGPGAGPEAAVRAGDGVVFTGFVSDEERDALVAGAAVLLQPSYMESFSLALVEGWLFGRPALVQGASPVLAGHVRRSGGGLTYTDYPTFEAALTTLLTRPALAERLADQGRQYARREFDWTAASQAFLSAVGDLSAAGAGAARGSDHG